MRKYTVWDFDELQRVSRLAHTMNLEWSSGSRAIGKGFGFWCDKRIERHNLFRCMLSVHEIQKDDE